MINYCKKCIEPDTRPNTVFTNDGICPVCNYYMTLSDVDWEERYQVIKEISEEVKGIPNQGFDCIIGVSGGKDSSRQALWVRDKLGLKPLLVSLSHPPEHVNQIGVDNISNLIELGFDVVILSPAPVTWRHLVKDSFFRFANWARSPELALFSSVPRLAIQYGISLIFWGENPAQTVGDQSVMGKTGYDGNNLRKGNTLSSGHQWMLDAGYAPGSLMPYIYPTGDEFDTANLKIIYLGWFLGDWSLTENALYSLPWGLDIRDESPLDTGDLYGISNLDEDWHLLNQMIKYYKFGFGKITEYVGEEIRSGKLTRDEAIKLVEKYDGKCSDRYIKSFCEYIEITTDEFWQHVLESVNKDLFDIGSNGEIRPKFKVGFGHE